MTPVQGSAEEVKDHFSFSTTLRRHTLGPTEDLLPFGRDSASRRGTGEAGGLEDKMRDFIGPAVTALGLEKFLPPRKDDDDDGPQFGRAMHDEPGSVDDGPAAPRLRGQEITTFSARYASMTVEVCLNAFTKLPNVRSLYCIVLRISSVPSKQTQIPDCRLPQSLICAQDLAITSLPLSRRDPCCESLSKPSTKAL